MGNNLTDREYWAAYWADYRYEKVPEHMMYEREFRHLTNRDSFIEIGGFPGIHCAYFYFIKTVTGMLLYWIFMSTGGLLIASSSLIKFRKEVFSVLKLIFSGTGLNGNSAWYFRRGLLNILRIRKM